MANTATSVIEDAMKEAGLLGEGDVPTAPQYAGNLRKLTDMINLWQTQGLKLWLNRETVIIPIAGNSLYTFGPTGTTPMPKPLSLISASFYDNSQYPSGRPITLLSWSDFVTLGQRTQPGSITSVFVDKQMDLLKLTFWQVPTAHEAKGSVKLLFRVQVAQPLVLSAEMEFPVEWRIALVWGLADEICGGQPQAIMDRCAARAAMYRKMLEEWDQEDVEVKFTPSSMLDSAYRFR